MDASLLRLGQALLGYEARMSVLSDNVANAGTAGFKAVSMTALSFDGALSEAVGNAAGGSGDQTLYFTLRTDIDYSQGDLQKTGNDADLALSGSGFFCVQTGDGPAYVRSVSPRVDGAGYLTDANATASSARTAPSTLATAGTPSVVEARS
jgi:flagellar hook-basal body protein